MRVFAAACLSGIMFRMRRHSGDPVPSGMRAGLAFGTPAENVLMPSASVQCPAMAQSKVDEKNNPQPKPTPTPGASSTSTSQNQTSSNKASIPKGSPRIVYWSEK